MPTLSAAWKARVKFLRCKRNHVTGVHDQAKRRATWTTHAAGKHGHLASRGQNSPTQGPSHFPANTTCPGSMLSAPHRPCLLLTKHLFSPYYKMATSDTPALSCLGMHPKS